MKYKSFVLVKRKIPSLGDFFLGVFIFNIIFDPGNELFHTKVITFFLALVTNIKKIKFRSYPIFSILIFYIAFFISVAVMLFRSHIEYDTSFVLMYATTFLTLIVLFLDPEKIHIETAFFFTCKLIAAITIVISIIIINFPAAVIFITENEKLNTIFMMAEHKKVLWWWVSSVFHKASPVLIFALNHYLVLYLKGKQRKNGIYVLFFFSALFLTGTRANIFSAILVVCFIYLCFTLYEKKQLYKSVFIIVIFVGFALLGTVLLLTVKNSSSVAKDGHIVSYISLFSENPSYFLIGTGPGSYFYTEGFGKAVTNTEISYLELIRMFGIFFSILIVCIYMYPFFLIRKIENFENLSLAISYLAYLFIAGTNPFLIGPIGFMALWIAYIWLYKQNKHPNVHKSIKKISC